MGKETTRPISGPRGDVSRDGVPNEKPARTGPSCDFGHPDGQAGRQVEQQKARTVPALIDRPQQHHRARPGTPHYSSFASRKSWIKRQSCPVSLTPTPLRPHVRPSIDDATVHCLIGYMVAAVPWLPRTIISSGRRASPLPTSLPLTMVDAISSRLPSASRCSDFVSENPEKNLHTTLERPPRYLRATVESSSSHPLPPNLTPRVLACRRWPTCFAAFPGEETSREDARLIVHLEHEIPISCFAFPGLSEWLSARPG